MTRIWLHPRDGAAYEAVARFLADRIGAEVAGWQTGTIMAVAKGDRIVAAVLFHNWQPRHGVIEVSGASDDRGWLSRAVLFDLFDYAFNQMGAQAVVARMDADRPLGRRFEAYGFRRYDIPRLRGRDKAETVMVLGNDEWTANGWHKENADGR